MMSLIRGILDLCSANIRRVEFATQQEGLWHQDFMILLVRLVVNRHPIG